MCFSNPRWAIILTKRIGKSALFGLKKSNRDFNKKDSWGKNQFNTSFPASLCCYFDHKDINSNYLLIQDKIFKKSLISVKNLFRISPKDDDIYFAFEAQHTPYQKYLVGTLPRTDLVIQKESTGECISSIEIKLTAIPDNTTCELDNNSYGAELIVRPDTIVYLACSIISGPNNQLRKHLVKIDIKDWSDADEIQVNIKKMAASITAISRILGKVQTPLLLQPIWKTQGKRPKLAEKCLDIFTWSNAAFVYFMAEVAINDSSQKKITRIKRSLVWLFKMLSDFCENGRFGHEEIIDTLSYNTKNDKAFAVSGNITNKYMSCDRLANPIISKNEIKSIILGGGQNMLSPERRFDAVIYNSQDVF